MDCSVAEENTVGLAELSFPLSLAKKFVWSAQKTPSGTLERTGEYKY